MADDLLAIAMEAVPNGGPMEDDMQPWLAARLRGILQDRGLAVMSTEPANNARPVAALIAGVRDLGGALPEPTRWQIARQVLAALSSAGYEIVPATDALAAERERAEDMEDWITGGADHHPGCSGGFPPHRCKCGLTDLLGRISRDHEGPTP